MRSTLRAIATVLIGLGAATCTGPAGHPRSPAPPPGPDTDTGVAAGLSVTITLRYRRPALFRSGGRPEGFYVIVDYRHESAATEYPGLWNDQTQTLSATVTVPLRVENLVYVVDPALQPGATTLIEAARGALKDVPCPATVDPTYSCELLQVLR